MKMIFKTYMHLRVVLCYLYRFASFVLHGVHVISYHKEKVSNEVDDNARALLFSLNYVQRIQYAHGIL